MLMFKQVILASAVAGLLAGTALPLATSADASSGCLKAAKAKYASDHKARHEYRKWCKSEWKAHKKAEKA
jgi:hypothetical protein